MIKFSFCSWLVEQIFLKFNFLLPLPLISVGDSFWSVNDCQQIFWVVCKTWFYLFQVKRLMELVKWNKDCKEFELESRGNSMSLRFVLFAKIWKKFDMSWKSCKFFNWKCIENLENLQKPWLVYSSSSFIVAVIHSLK